MQKIPGVDYNLSQFCSLIHNSFGWKVSGVNLIVLGKSAIRCELRKTATMPNDWVENLASDCNWFVSKKLELRSSVTIDIENMHGYSAIVQSDAVFHVTDAGSVQSILATGLELKSGGSTWLSRSYTPRIYYSRNLWDAFTFISSKALERPALMGPDPNVGSKLSRYAIFKVNAQGVGILYEDDFFIGALYGERRVKSSSLVELENISNLFDACLSWRQLSYQLAPS